MVGRDIHGRFDKGHIPSEVVHHINGDIKDNTIENLMLFPSNSSHCKYHHKKKGV